MSSQTTSHIRQSHASTGVGIGATQSVTAVLIALAMLLLAGLAASASAQERKRFTPAPTCNDLVWSAQLLKEDPDIDEYCQGIYVKGDTLYAKLRIELVRVRANRLSFRAIHPDGNLSHTRSITIKPDFRVNIDGESLRARDLLPGQQLSVYIPEDRFALSLDDGMFDGDEEMLSIEKADVVKMQ